MQRFRLTVVLMCLTVFAGVLSRSAAAQQTQAAPAAAAPGTSNDGVVKGPPTVEQPDPLKRKLSDAEKIKQQKALRQEHSPEDKKWLNEDARLHHHR